MLKYSLSENYLTERPDDYSAQTHANRSYDIHAVIDRMLQRGNLLTKTDILAVWNGLLETVSDITREGGTINTELINTSFSISGVFESPMDSFDANRHKLNLNITKGITMRQVEKEVKLSKTESSSPQSNIQEVKDSVSGTVNEFLTANGVVEVRGYNIKITGDDSACGLWFVPEQGEAIKAMVIIENKPSTVIAMIPALQTNVNYHLKITTQYTGSGTMVKVPKTVTYQKALTVKNN